MTNPLIIEMTGMTRQEIESLLLNADDRETFEGLTYAQASAFQRIAYYHLSGIGVVIHCDSHSNKPNRYAAEVRYV